MNTYSMVKEFLRKYPMTIAWRVKRHSEIINKHINPNEKILYIFAGQLNESYGELFNTYVVAFTNERIMLATKRVFFGYFFKSITYDMYNDLTLHKGLIFGKVIIDTVKELVTITNIDPKALTEIETNITEIILKYRKTVAERNKKEKKNA